MTARLAKLLMLSLILLTTWLRLWHLNSTPPGLWFDEGFNGMEVVWMLKTHNWPLFILGGQGREVMFFYLLALSVTVFGETVYALRLVPALLSILSVPLMYRWVLILFTDREAKSGEDRESILHGIALISAAGLVVSFWLLVMNRVSYRANTLLPIMLITCYFFWQGWQTGKIRSYLLAGLGLGLCQYTYLAGRLVPLIFVIFTSAQTLLNRSGQQARLKRAWLGLLLMGSVAALVFAPMLVVFTRYPELFWERSGDVALEVSQVDTGTQTLIEHLAAAVRVFVDGQDPNWRHHLLGRPVFDWFSNLGFWLGLVAVIRGYRRSANLFLLSILGVMWLPALLSEPAFHTLRLVGILPAYYVLGAIGLTNLVEWLRGHLWPLISSAVSPPCRLVASWPVALLSLLVFSGGTTFYDYFYRWAERTEVYDAFEGQLSELANHLTSAETKTNAIIPFYLYAHASMRYKLYQYFKEAVLLPAEVSTRLSGLENVNLIIPEYPANDSLPPALVWLVQDGTQPGVAYISAVRRDVTLAQLAAGSAELIKDSRGQVMIHQYQLDPQEVLPLFPQTMPQKKAAVSWGDNLGLVGYEFVPAAVEADRSSNLVLAWQILSYTGLEEKMFLQLLDSRGNPVGQQEVEPLSRKMYRWRDDGLILEQLPLQLGVDLSAGLYFVRLGFFNPDTGQRLPAFGPNGQPMGDEFMVGPLYLSLTGQPPQPQQMVKARLGDNFELWGYTLSPGPDNTTQVELFWQSLSPTDQNYTVFVQLLDSNNQIIAQADVQPLANIYPPSRWQPGDIISEQFTLPMAPSVLSTGVRLVTGMYDLSTGARLPVYNQQNQLQSDGLIELRD